MIHFSREVIEFKHSNNNFPQLIVKYNPVTKALYGGNIIDTNKGTMKAFARQNYDRDTPTLDLARLEHMLTLAEQGNSALISATISPHVTYETTSITLSGASVLTSQIDTNPFGPVATNIDRKAWKKTTPAQLLVARLAHCTDKERAVYTLFQRPVLNELNEVATPEAYEFFLEHAATEVPEFLLFVVTLYNRKYAPNKAVQKSPQATIKAIKEKMTDIFTGNTPEKRKIAIMRRIADDLKKVLQSSGKPPDKYSEEIHKMLLCMQPANQQRREVDAA